MELQLLENLLRLHNYDTTRNSHPWWYTSRSNNHKIQNRPKSSHTLILPQQKFTFPCISSPGQRMTQKSEIRAVMETGF